MNSGKFENLKREKTPSLRSSGQVPSHSDEKLAEFSHSDRSVKSFCKTAKPSKKNQWDDQIKTQALFSSSNVYQAMPKELKQSNLSSDTSSIASTISNVPQKKCNKRKKQESFSQDTTISSISAPKSSFYSRFITFILTFSPFISKTKSSPIPNVFKTTSTYKNYFEAAFYVEFEAILKEALEETPFSNNYLVNLQMNEEPALIFPKEANEAKFEYEVCDNDVVLIIPEQDSCPINFKELTESHINWTIGLVTKRLQTIEENKKEIVKILINKGRRRELKDNRKYIVIVIGNVTSLKREILNLENVDGFSFKDQILSPQPYQSSVEQNISENFKKTIREKYNESQASAIEKSINPDTKISLIKGPPGTGKTTTAIGIISGFYEINPNAKTFVCAQSHTAVDAITSAVLKNGIFDEYGNKRNDIILLSIGEKWEKHEFGVEEAKPSCEIEKSINSMKLNVILEKKLNDEGLYNPTSEIAKLIQKHEKIEKKLKKLQGRKYDKMKNLLIEINEEITNLTKLKTKYFQKREKYTAEIISSAHIIFCTLSGAGSAIVSKNINSIDYLIIDEACQSLELSTLIPFQYNPKSVIFLGDPKQLSATIISQIVKENNYGRSFFERRIDCGIEITLLTTQYRMIEEISDFTSETFYENQICTDESVISRPIPNWAHPEGLYFFNLCNSREMQGKNSKSYFNENEAQFVLSLYEELRKKIKKAKASIAIISPYRGQVQRIKELLDEKYRKSWKKHCEISTVDGFQGREVDVVIFSAVRSQYIGFLQDERRMNVAISRAKYAVYGIGNEDCLVEDCLVEKRYWGKLMKYCRDNGKFKFCSGFHKVKNIFSKQ